jgi:exonuclease VII large subunit
MIVVYTFFQTTLPTLTNLLPIYHLAQMTSPHGTNDALPIHRRILLARNALSPTEESTTTASTSPPSSLDDADKQIRELNQTLGALRESRATQRLKLQHKSKDASDHVRAVRAKEQQTNVQQYEMLSKLQDLDKLLAFVNTTRIDPTRWRLVSDGIATTTVTSHQMLSSGFSTTKAAANELFEVPEYEPGYHY